jgi:uncharacterized protein (TIGR02679 family)
MTAADDIRRLYGQDGLQPLWRELRRRLEHDTTVATVVLRGMDEDARVAVAELLGRWDISDPVRIPIERLARAVEPHAPDEIVVALHGPLQDHAGRRRAEAQAKAELWSWLAEHPVVLDRNLHAWAADQRRVGIVDGSVENTRELLQQALTVIEQLPSSEAVDRQILAARALGPTHALDDKQPLSRIVLSALAVQRDVEAPRTARERRALWRSHNVVVDEYSSVVLIAGVRPRGTGLLARLLSEAADVGQPFAATLAQVTEAESLDWPTGSIHVVENPSVLSAAIRRLGPSCPPIVCTSGWPVTAATTLLQLLADLPGTELRYSGDLDPEGLAIASWLAARVPLDPWRMDLEVYSRALAAGSVEGPCGPVSLTDPPDWLSELADELDRRRVAVCQEHIIDQLLDDLANEAAARAGPAIPP